MTQTPSPTKPDMRDTELVERLRSARRKVDALIAMGLLNGASKTTLQRLADVTKDAATALQSSAVRIEELEEKLRLEQAAHDKTKCELRDAYTTLAEES